MVKFTVERSGSVMEFDIEPIVETNKDASGKPVERKIVGITLIKDLRRTPCSKQPGARKRAPVN